MEYQLKTRQVCLFFIAFIPLGKFFMMPSVIAGISGEDMWISALINMLLDASVLSVLLFVARKADCDVYTLIERSLGKFGARAVLILYLVYFLLKSVLSINEQREYIEMTMYLNSQSIVYFLPFFVGMFFLCLKKLRVIGRAADIFIISTVIGYLILMGLSINSLDLSYLLPVGANGIGKILKGSFSSLNWFGDAVYFLFFIGEFRYKKKDGFKIIGCYFIAVLMIVLFLFVFYSVFNFIAPRQRFALTETSKYTTTVNNLERFDYFGILLILISEVVGASLPVFFATKILCKLIKTKHKWIPVLAVVGIELVFILVFGEYYYSIENFIIGYAGWFYLTMGIVFPLLSPLLLLKKEKPMRVFKINFKEKKSAVR